ncbi:hypothetical protein CHCC20441_4499 [Bacillus licheniformis]|nr:hypothetical protein B4092_3039 [Bacillus licheniformis]TWN15836.1 hypothetical protein CHCC14564_0401 [Bacillus licheniformis LMG 17339]KYC76394.1 hypothetical protein B4090_3080 [Bacillus licheniformis]KYC80889.1 hypothetical protein B4091_2908 [Bacillus licheniformis]OLF90450.1 hypothetical protein B4089_2775 [Bacillus licheniformis]
MECNKTMQLFLQMLLIFGSLADMSGERPVCTICSKNRAN